MGTKSRSPWQLHVWLAGVTDVHSGQDLGSAQWALTTRDWAGDLLLETIGWNPLTLETPGETPA